MFTHATRCTARCVWPRVGRLHAARALLALVPVLIGCHAPLTGVATGFATRAPAWPGPDLQPGPVRDVLPETYPLEIAPHDNTVGEVLTIAVMRRLVLEYHPAVRAARFKLAETQARGRTAGRWPNPELDGRLLAADDGATEIEGALRFRLPVGGRLGAAGRSARLEVERARAELVAASQAALWELDALLISLAWARGRLSLHEELASRSGRYSEVARKRQLTSLADPLDVSLVLVDAAQDRRAVIRSHNTVASLEAQVRLLMGLAPGERQITTFSLATPHPAIEADALPSLAAEHRGDLIRAGLDWQRAEWVASEASRARVPDLVVGPALAGNSTEVSLGVTFGVSLPILKTGDSSYRAALARRDAAYDAFQAAARDAEVTIERCHVRFGSLGAELAELTEAAAAAASEALALAQERHAAGQIDVLRLLSAHRAYADLQLEVLDLLRGQWEALLDLEQAVGWPLRSVDIDGTAGR